jgi:hypothetical protein
METKMPFQPGQSGNPAGRPRGARNNTTVLIEQLLEGDAEFIMRRLIAQAKAGNPRALSLLMPALLPKRKDRPIELELPTLEEASDAPRAIAAIIAAVCAGEVTPSEGTSLTRMVEAYVRARHKTGQVGCRPAREKAADVAAAKMREPGEQAPSAAHAQANAPTQADESIDSPAPEPVHAAFALPAGRSLPRLRQEVLSSISPLAQSAKNMPTIVSPLLSVQVAADANVRMPAAA